jgi:hypothetical protein
MNKLFNLLFSIFLIFLLGVCGACTRNSPNNFKTEIDTNATTEDSVIIESSIQSIPKVTQTLHVFIENSGSMNGYINSISDFQMAIGRAIQLMKFKYGEDNIKTYYINTKISKKVRPEGTDLYTFVQQMLQRSHFTSSGSTASTDLNDIVKNVLDSVDENNTAILISDFIYSLPSTNGVTTNLLYGCQNLTMSAFLEKTKKMNNTLLATNLVQLFSGFQGHYWHWEKPTGNQYVNLNCQRPYYICIMGTDDNVKDFNKSINIESLKGYKNQFTISNKNMANTSYTIFDTKYKKGKYRHDNTDAIHYINKVRKTTNNEFELGIGIDLSDFTMSESDKLDIANYTINQGNYQILKIEPIDTLKLTNPTDKKLVRKNNCTHAIVLACTGFPNDISISIKRKLPSWVSNASSTDDRCIATDINEQTKTFGLSYFVAGISDAYNYLANDKQNFMTINIRVTN